MKYEPSLSQVFPTNATAAHEDAYHGIPDATAHKIIGEYLEKTCFPNVASPEENDPSLGEKFSGIYETAREEFSENPNKVSAVTWGIAALGSQVLDRARVSIVLVPEVATYVMENSHNSLLTGLATGGTIFLWCGGVGEVFGRALHKFPRSVAKFTDSFPGFVDTFSDSLAGVENKRQLPVDSVETHKDQEIIPDEEQKMSLRERFRINRKQGTTTIGIGSTIFVGTATANGYTPEETSRLNLKVSANAGVLGAILGLTISETLMQLAENGHMELANDIQNNVVGNRYVWLGLAALSMTSEFVQSRIKKHQSKTPDVTDTELLQTETQT